MIYMGIDKKFIINLQGNEFVKFEGLLAEFHANGGKSIETEETPSSTFETPCFKATVEGENGKFTGHGDANNTNVNTMIAKHKYRMAETRAIARALRWYNNIGMCSVDELGGDIQEAPKKATQANPDAFMQRNVQSATTQQTPPPQPEYVPLGKMTTAQAVNTLNGYKKEEKIEGGTCKDCGAKLVKNPKTGKIFCEKKCWLDKSTQVGGADVMF